MIRLPGLILLALGLIGLVLGVIANIAGPDPLLTQAGAWATWQGVGPMLGSLFMIAIGLYLFRTAER